MSASISSVVAQVMNGDISVPQALSRMGTARDRKALMNAIHSKKTTGGRLRYHTKLFDKAWTAGYQDSAAQGRLANSPEELSQRKNVKPRGEFGEPVEKSMSWDEAIEWLQSDDDISKAAQLLQDFTDGADLRKSYEQIMNMAQSGRLPKGKRMPGQPEAVFMQGLPGAGKSTHISERFGHSREHDLISPDIIKKQHPHYRNDAQVTQALHGWSKKHADAALDNAIQNRRSFIYDGTGTKKKSTVERIQRAKKAGYHTRVHTVAVPLSVSLQRVQQRKAAGGHEVPEPVIRKKAAEVGSTFMETARHADHVEVDDRSPKPNEKFTPPKEASWGPTARATAQAKEIAAKHWRGAGTIPGAGRLQTPLPASAMGKSEEAMSNWGEAINLLKGVEPVNVPDMGAQPPALNSAQKRYAQRFSESARPAGMPRPTTSPAAGATSVKKGDGDKPAPEPPPSMAPRGTRVPTPPPPRPEPATARSQFQGTENRRPEMGAGPARVAKSTWESAQDALLVRGPQAHRYGLSPEEQFQLRYGAHYDPITKSDEQEKIEAQRRELVSQGFSWHTADYLDI